MVHAFATIFEIPRTRNRRGYPCGFLAFAQSKLTGEMMATLILVHGSWHSARAWDKLIPLLTSLGHNVVAPDMPGRGANPAPLEEQTFANYVDTLVTAIDESEGDVFLVGHSAGGAVISQAAEERTEKIAGLIYISGFMLQSGQSILDIAGSDSGNEVLAAAETIEDGKAMMLLPKKARTPLYLDCSDETVREAVDQLVPEATEPVGAKVYLTNERYGSVPRFYVECLQDRAISIGVQREMIRRQPVEKVASMETSHSPFLSKPGELTGALVAFLK